MSELSTINFLAPDAIMDDSVPASDGGRDLPSAKGGKLTTLSRGLQILEFVARSNRFVKLKDVASHFSLDRATALRFIRTLEMEGYLVRHEAMKVYSLGPKLQEFRRVPARVEEIIEFARPILARLSQVSGQMSHLAVLSGNQAVLVEVAASDTPVFVKQAVGDLEPLNSSAVGKALYAFMPSGERDFLAGQIEFVAHTTRTIMNIDALEAEAARVRESGVAFDRREGNDHVCCMACPVRNSSGFPVASIGLSYVHALLPQPIDERAGDIGLIMAAAREIEACMTTGLRPPSTAGA